MNNPVTTVKLTGIVCGYKREECKPVVAKTWPWIFKQLTQFHRVF